MLLRLYGQAAGANSRLVNFAASKLRNSSHPLRCYDSVRFPRARSCAADGRRAVSQSPIKSLSLLALCGLFYAMLSFIILLMISPDAGPTLRVFGNGRDTAQQLGMLA